MLQRGRAETAVTQTNGLRQPLCILSPGAHGSPTILHGFASEPREYPECRVQDTKITHTGQ